MSGTQAEKATLILSYTVRGRSTEIPIPDEWKWENEEFEIQSGEIDLQISGPRRSLGQAVSSLLAAMEGLEAARKILGGWSILVSSRQKAVKEEDEGPPCTIA